MVFRNKYSFLSNMYPCEIKVELFEHTYNFTCVESAFQALKCPYRINDFSNLNGIAAKKLGKEVKNREDWEDVKVEIMHKLISQKFSNPVLMEQLRNIEGDIVETNYWNDTFWGMCKGVGQNTLGKILMDIRDNGVKQTSYSFNKYIRPYDSMVLFSDEMNKVTFKDYLKLKNDDPIEAQNLLKNYAEYYLNEKMFFEHEYPRFITFFSYNFDKDLIFTRITYS